MVMGQAWLVGSDGRVGLGQAVRSQPPAVALAWGAVRSQPPAAALAWGAVRGQPRAVVLARGGAGQGAAVAAGLAGSQPAAVVAGWRGVAGRADGGPEKRMTWSSMRP
jgi:hypothetical protein